MRANMKKAGTSTVAIAITLALAVPAVTQAQTGADPVADEDIIVTASRRSVDLQALPLAVTAISEARIEALGARAKDDLVYVSPGLSFTDSGGGRQNFTIRGVQALSGEATTAFYVDETPVSRGVEAQFDIRLFDIDRVEVLRGPQGTLFGASSMGGAIRVITRKPDSKDFAARVDGRLSMTRNGHLGYDINGALNIPIVQDRLAFRVVGFRERVSGFIGNYRLSIDPNGAPVVGALVKSPAGDRELYGIRAALRFDVTDDVALTATYYRQNSEFDGVAGEDADPTDPAAGLTVGGLRQSRAFVERPGNLSQQYNLTAEYSGDAVNFVSSTSYSKTRDIAQEDFTRRFGGVFGPPELDIFQVARGWEFTQEARLLSAGDKPFNWLIGAFYTKSELSANQLLRDRSTPGFPALFDFTATNPNSEFSFFGEFSYRLTDKLTATGGLRRYSATRKFSNLTLAGPLTGPLDDLSVGNATETGVTYRGLLSYQASDAHLFYFSVSTGYRPGGPNTTVPSPTGAITPPPFTSDGVQQFELGWKSSFFDRRVTLNGALYYLKWTDIQIPIRDPSGDFTFTGNGGKAYTAGLELELTARVTDDLTINSNVSIQRAKFDQDVATLNVLSGDRLPSVPDFSGSIGASYETQISTRWRAYADAIYSYTGTSVTNAARDENGVYTFDQLGNYSLVNLSFGLRNGSYQFGVFGRNLTDARGLIGRRASGTEGVATRQYIAPRVFGVEFKANF